MNGISNLIESLASWGQPSQPIPTRRGLRMLRTAACTPTFWTAWRAQKADLQAAGVTCKPDGNGQWEAQWWQDPPAEAATSPVAQPQPPLQATGSPESVQSSIPRYPTLVEEPVEPQPSVFSKSKAEQLVKDALALPWKPSEEQQAIFTWFKSSIANGVKAQNLCVRARAGCGKTSTAKVAFGFAPESTIAYLVFNVRNKEEAKAAITDERVDVMTLNGLGHGYILAVWPGTKPDDAVEFDRLDAAYKDLTDEVRRATLKLVAFAKNTFVSVPSIDELVGLADERGVEAANYEKEDAGGFVLRKLAEMARGVMVASLGQDGQKRISFNDQVWIPVVKGWVRPRYELVAVDECQDMNMLQLTMAQGAATPGGRVVVIGDDRQAIYGFRGAVSDGLDMMKARLNAAELGLTVTRRCGKSIVAVARPIVPDYRAADDAPNGEVLGVDEALAMQQVQPGDAVLSRINAPLMSLCLQALKRGVPARIQGRDIGKALLGMVKSLKARSVPDFMRRAESWADKQIARAKGSKHQDARVEAVHDQLDMMLAVAEGAASVGEIERRIEALFQDRDGARKCVVFSSVHKGKGLEWDRVFVLSRTFSRKRPAGSKPPTEAETKEERNIFYVAVTRAKKTLVLCQGR